MSCKCDTINIVNDNNVIVVSHADGRDGKSAYQQAVEGGYTGTEQEFNCSLSLLADVKQVKENLVSAIEYKGGTSNADKSFQGIAGDIREIPNFNLSGIEYLDGYKPTSALEAITNKKYIVSINNNNIKQLEGSYLFYDCNYLEEVEMNEVESIIGESIFDSCDNLKKISFNRLRNVTGASTFKYVPAYIKNFPELLNFTINMFSNIDKANRVYAPKVQNLINAFRYNRGLEWLEVGKLLSTEDIGQYTYGYENLRNITIGQDTNINLLLNSWMAALVIAEGQSGIDELNSNLYNNLLTKLYDHSNDGETRILQIGWLDYITPENIAYANAKGWTITN
jgi:hypothetical protein